MIPIPSYNAIAKLLKGGFTIEAQEKIMELRMAALTMREENFALRDEIHRLKEAQSISVQIERKGNCYYKKDDLKLEAPYCLACWDADKKLVSVVCSTSRGRHMFQCFICSSRKKM